MSAFAEIFDVLQTVPAGKSLDVLLNLCMEAEFQIPNEQFSLRTCQFYTIYLVALLFSSKLNEAKYLWKRISVNYKIIETAEPPKTPASSDESSAKEVLSNVWAVGIAQWQKDTARAMQLLFYSLWPQYLQPTIIYWRQALMTSYLESFGQFFAPIDVPLLEKLLGLPRNDFEEEAKSLGWIFDSVGNVTIPVKKVLLSYANSDIHKMESLIDNVEKLTGYVSFIGLKPASAELSGKTKQTGK